MDETSTEAREQQLYNDLQYAKAHLGPQTVEVCQRVYDQHLAKHNPKTW